MTFYLFFLVYLGAGILICGALFYWAVSNGQFKDQDRARFLPLQGEPEEKPVRKSAMSRVEVYALIFLACSGLLAIAAVLAFALIRGN